MLPMLPSTFCIAEKQDNTQGAFGYALTLYQTIFLKLERNFYLLALWFFFSMPSSCSGIQVTSKVQAAASSQVSQDSTQVLTSTARRHALGPAPSASWRESYASSESRI